MANKKNRKKHVKINFFHGKNLQIKKNTKSLNLINNTKIEYLDL